MINDNGTLLMMDPFHKWNFLARCKFSSQQVEEYMQTLGFKLEKRTGFLFWPYREMYSFSKIKNFKKMKRIFMRGERIMNFLGKNIWSDYKVLVFKKI